MNIYKGTVYIDAHGNACATFFQAAISFDIAQYDHFSERRKLRRIQQSLAVRDLLNNALCRQFNIDLASSWTLDKTESGKPYLSGDHAPFISMTHSGNWCACAIANTSPIGIDIEVVQYRDWESYSIEVLHPTEAQWVMAVDGKERDIRGLICWCRKEAILKALGLDISSAFTEIGFCAEGHLIALPSALGVMDDWTLFTQVIQEQIVVAVAWQRT
ncbi:MAG: 4'-phosphopantetheinyl transferase superfamily protein [Methylophilus sp.]|nr:4'-phosphopantetheinyl transferase superfamily protein [Methylophilus sp.]